MSTIPLGNDTDLDDSQFFNRKEELQFLTENLKLAEKDQHQPYFLLE